MLRRAVGVVCTGASLTSFATSSLAEIEGKDDGVSLLQVNALRMPRAPVKDVAAVDLDVGEVESHLPKTEVVHGTDSAKRSVHRYEYGYNGHQGENSAVMTEADLVVKKVRDSPVPNQVSPLPVSASAQPKTHMVKGTDSAKRSVHRHEYGYNGHQGESIAAMAKADLLVKQVDDTLRQDSAPRTPASNGAQIPLPKTDMVKGTDSAKRSVHRHEYGYNGHQGENSIATATAKAEPTAQADLLVREVGDTPSQDSAFSTPASSVVQDSADPLPKTDMVRGTDSAKRSVHRHEYGYNGHQGENSAVQAKADLLVKKTGDTSKQNSALSSPASTVAQDSATPLPTTDMVKGTDSAKRSVHRHEYGYNGHQGENSAEEAKVDLLVKKNGDTSKQNSALSSPASTVAQDSATPLPTTDVVKGTDSAKRSVNRHEYGYNGHQGENSAVEATANLLLKKTGDDSKQNSAFSSPASHVAQDSASPLPKTEMVKGTDSAKLSVHRHEYGYNGHQGENSKTIKKADLMVKDIVNSSAIPASASPLPKTDLMKGTDSAKRSVHRHEYGYNGHQGEDSKSAEIVSDVDAHSSQASLASIRDNAMLLPPTQLLKGSRSAHHTFQRDIAEDMVMPVPKLDSTKHAVDELAQAPPATLLGSHDSKRHFAASHVSKLSSSDVESEVSKSQKKHAGHGSRGGHGIVKHHSRVVAPDEDLCDPVSSLDFSAATVSHSNLGGQGPDSGDETLVFENIAIKNGEIVDLVVTATSSYAPRDAGKNGLSEGMGVVNLGVNTPVDLLFRFVSRATGAAVTMHPFYFTFLDLDQGRAHKSREKVIVQGLSSFIVSEDSSLDVTEEGSSTIFSSSMRGGKVDNPIAALSMNRLQRERSVVVTFRGISEFSVTLSEEEYADSDQGRNWFFAGPSQLVCDGEHKCTDYECPSGYHIRTMAEFLVCEEARCTEDDKDTCCFEEENRDEEDEGSNE